VRVSVKAWPGDLHRRARVVVAEFDRSTGQTVADAVSGLFIETDASDREQIEAAVAATVTEFGAVDIVVNNAWSGGGIGRVENKTGGIPARPPGSGRRRVSPSTRSARRPRARPS
jgi:NAD(P)-dependent dehydrogenase (short-subunit alcohol dehydrogenase family)